MPCDTRRTVGVTLEKSDAATLLAALTDLKLSPRQRGDMIYFGQGESINTVTGLAQLAWNRTASEIKQAYSRAIVQRTAKRMGWQLRVDAKNPNQLEIFKR